MALNENVKKWVAALRSGDYKQTTGVLHRTKPSENAPEGYCCFGVACEVFLAENPDRIARYMRGGWTDDREVFGGSTTLPPEPVLTWLGLRNEWGAFDDEDGYEVALTSMNDQGASFEDIAAVIESEPKGLFIA